MPPKKVRTCLSCNQSIPVSDYCARGYQRANFCKKPECQAARKQRAKEKAIKYRKRVKSCEAPRRTGEYKNESGPEFSGYHCQVCGKPIRIIYTAAGQPIIYRRLCSTHRHQENKYLNKHNIENDLIYQTPAANSDTVAAIDFV